MLEKMATIDTRERVRYILDGEGVIAQVYDLNLDGSVVFPTSDEAEMQCAFGQVARDKSVAPHVHNTVARKIRHTSEFILVLKGRADVVFYDDAGSMVDEATLLDSMAFLQFSGGHGIDFAAGTKYIEVKQGPYFGPSADKTPIQTS